MTIWSSRKGRWSLMEFFFLRARVRARVLTGPQGPEF
jgi:hypothetical protein